MSTAPLPLQFVTSADRLERLPDRRCEVALIGRSNVGKSSLINALSRRKDLAKTSKTPGRTQLLNCFALDDDRALIDCPGYGYASVSKTTRAQWTPMVRRYLVERGALRQVLLLVDGEVGPTKLDLEMLEWLREHDLPFTVVATKHDKVRSAKRERRKRDLAAGCGLDPKAIVWVSASSGVGIDRLRSLIVEVLD